MNLLCSGDLMFATDNSCDHKVIHLNLLEPYYNFSSEI